VAGREKRIKNPGLSGETDRGDWLGHRNIQYTVRYTALAPDRFKDFWR